jgi:hypothetical protein
MYAGEVSFLQQTGATYTAECTMGLKAPTGHSAVVWPYDISYFIYCGQIKNTIKKAGVLETFSVVVSIVCSHIKTEQRKSKSDT